MKQLFIPAKSSAAIIPTQQDIKKLPTVVGVVTTIQHMHKLPELIAALKKAGKNPLTARAGHALYEGQILGCSFAEIKNADAYLYVGGGKFHPLQIALNTDKQVYIYNPLTGIFALFDRSAAEKIKKRTQGAYVTFLSSHSIGILVSTKPGQNNTKKALLLKQKLESEGKQCYIFAVDTLVPPELENFPFIQCWVNTLCPRIGTDDSARTTRPILNMADIDSMVF